MLGLVLSFCAAPQTASAQSGGKTVRVHVSTILATKRHDKIDPKLKSIAKQLKQSFKFTGFESKGDTSKSGPLNKKMSFSLPSPYSLEVTPTSKNGDAVTLRIAVFEKKKGEKKKSKLSTTVTVRRGKHQLVGGLPAKGGKLVLAISGN